MIDSGAGQCPRHGRACLRSEAAVAEAALASESPEGSTSLRDGVEAPSFRVTGEEPNVGLTFNPSFVQEAWEKAFTETIHVPPSKAYAPIRPAPRLLRMRIG